MPVDDAMIGGSAPGTDTQADVAMVCGPVLGIETSGRLTGAALVVDGRLAAETCVDAHASSQEILIDLTLRILESHRLRVRDLVRIGVSLGPGSFTGVRVGLAAGRGLALGAGSFLRVFQVGNVQSYAFFFGVAVIALILFLIL